MRQKIIFTILFLFSTTGVFAQGIDLRLLEYIDRSGTPTATTDWKFVSNASFYVDAAVPVTFIITGILNDDEATRVKGYDEAASILIAGGGALIIKDIVQRERPFIAHPGVIIPKVDESGYSFPSGHASLAFTAATSLSIAEPKWYVIVPSFAYASAVGYSRLYLGVHYPSDVLGGAIVGAGSAYLTHFGQRWLDRKHSLRVHQPQGN